MPETNDTAKRYRYGFLWKLGAAFFSVLAIASIGLAISFGVEGKIGASLFFLLIAAVPVFFCLCILLSSATICIDDGGITAHVLGRKTAFIRWQDVRRIKKNRPQVVRDSGYQDSFNIYDDDMDVRWFRELMGNLRGPIQINDSIRGFSELWDRIEGYAQHYGIPIIECEEVVRDLMLQRRSGRPGAEHEKNPNSAWRKYARFPESPGELASNRRTKHFAGRTMKLYKYKRFSNVYGWIFAAATAFFATLAIMSANSNDFKSSFILSLFAFLEFFITVLFFLAIIPVGINDEGIFYYKFGLKLKAFRWQEVRKIRKLRRPAAVNYCSHSFHVYGCAPSIFRTFLCKLRNRIIFRDTICNLEELLDYLNAYAWHYGIPLVVEDLGDALQQVTQDGQSRRIKLPEAPEIRIMRI